MNRARRWPPDEPDQPADPVDTLVDAAPLDLRHIEREVALTHLFETQATQLTRLAVLLGAGGDAEDVVSEAFCDLHRRWGRLRDPAAAPAWLRAAVCNQVRMRIRHRQVERRHDQATHHEQQAGGPESEVVGREDQVELLAALRSLSERQREALVLRYWLDLREAEVAGAMGISAGSVKTHTSRGMLALERALAPTRSPR